MRNELKKLVILHEGSDKKTHDNELVKLLIESLNFNEKLISFYGMGSKSNFFDLSNEKYSFLKNIHVQVEKILFILDADSDKNDVKYGGYDNTLKEIKAVIKELDIEILSDIYIMCNPETKEGYLESLILATIPDEHKRCIENFLSCSRFASKENHKAILHSIYKVAYPQAPYNFEHHYFDELKQKLDWLFN